MRGLMTRRGRHIISDPRLETAAGIAALLAAWMLLYDAHDARGGKLPWFLRWVAWW